MLVYSWLGYREIWRYRNYWLADVVGLTVLSVGLVPGKVLVNDHPASSARFQRTFSRVGKNV
jgi:hypothetical protein